MDLPPAQIIAFHIDGFLAIDQPIASIEELSSSSVCVERTDAGGTRQGSLTGRDFNAIF